MENRDESIPRATCDLKHKHINPHALLYRKMLRNPNGFNETTQGINIK